jgi:hypothetical protein
MLLRVRPMGYGSVINTFMCTQDQALNNAGKLRKGIGLHEHIQLMALGSTWTHYN